jgi:DNA-binding CsgD family transcriptional regulator
MEDSKTISLTKREKTILSEIAEKFGLSPETVKWYRKQMLVKFSAATSAEMIRKAVEKGML